MNWAFFGVLMFILFINGCSMNGLFFNASNDKQIVVIEHPPNRLAYVGNFNRAEREQLGYILRLMQTQKFREHSYSYPLSATVSSTVIKEDRSTFDATPLIPTKLKGER